MKYTYDTEKRKLVECDGQHLTQAQQNYFKDSKLRDEDGDLVECFHYTVHSFDAFDSNTIGNQSGDDGYFGKGFYFTGMPSFNSCCWADKEKGEELIMLKCYLDLKNPFLFSKLEKGERDYSLENIYTYDKETFLQYLKDNSENGIDIVLSEEDFIVYLKEETYEYVNIIEQYENGDITFYEEIDGVSLDDLYNEAVRNRDIITPENLIFSAIHRGLLGEYSQQITDYAKANGFDGIVSDGTGYQAVEIVVFNPNQIKLVNNLYPTKSDNFKDNSREYLQEHLTDISLEECMKITKHIKEVEKQEKAKDVNRKQTKDKDER